MHKRYRVIFLGLIESEEHFKQRMSPLGATHDIVEIMLQKAPVILKGGMTLSDARRYAEAIQHAGGRVRIQEDGEFEEPVQEKSFINIQPLANFTMCPECGLKQLKSDQCARCGFQFNQLLEA